LIVGSLLAMTLWTTPAFAGEPGGLRLTYATPDDARCPDEASFRNLVAARLGHDPFVATGPDAVRVAVARDRGRLHGRVEVTRSGQAPSSARELSGEADKCEALAAALATTLAIALDPMRAPAPVPPPAPPPAASTVVIVEQAPAPPPEPPRPNAPAASPTPIVVFGVAGGVASVAAAPSFTLGGEIGLGVRVRAFSILAAGRAEATPGPVRVDSGDRLQAAILSGSLAPCAHLGGWSGCAFARVGAFQGYAPDVVSPSLGTTVFASVGARVGYSLVLSRALALRPTLEGALPIVRTSLVIDKSVVWTAPPASAGAGLALLVYFM
jgi:hypothetical protein